MQFMWPPVHDQWVPDATHMCLWVRQNGRPTLELALDQA